jgi:hypothetical protein
MHACNPHRRYKQYISLSVPIRSHVYKLAGKHTVPSSDPYCLKPTRASRPSFNQTSSSYSHSQQKQSTIQIPNTTLRILFSTTKPTSLSERASERSKTNATAAERSESGVQCSGRPYEGITERDINGPYKQAYALSLHGSMNQDVRCLIGHMCVEKPWTMEGAVKGGAHV